MDILFCDIPFTISTEKHKRIFLGKPKTCWVLFNVGDTVGVRATKNFLNNFREAHLEFIFDLVVLDDIYCSVGANNCDFVNVLWAKEMVSNFDDPLFTKDIRM